MVFSKKKKRVTHERSDLFDGLPDDIVISILCKLSATASAPSEFISVLITCKRLNRLALHPLVLSKAGPKTLALSAKNWSEDAHRFLKLCVAAGNTEASYFLGMIRFYCLKNRGSGASLMAKAAIRSHAPALYSLALIQFNGSGGLKNDKDLRAGVALCARAAFLGHVDALRELGHCLQDGYGVRKNVAEGRRLLVQANARELASVLCTLKSLPMPLPLSSSTWQTSNQPRRILFAMDSATDAVYSGLECGLWSDFGCNLPVREVHPADKFLVEWFGLKGGEAGNGLRMCSHGSCGRPETRRNEYRRCSGCGKVNYCSRGCQAHDWRMHHKVECAPMEEWMDQDPMEDVEDHQNGDEVVGDDQTVEIEDDVVVAT